MIFESEPVHNYGIKRAFAKYFSNIVPLLYFPLAVWDDLHFDSGVLKKGRVSHSLQLGPDCIQINHIILHPLSVPAHCAATQGERLKMPPGLPTSV